MENQDLASRSNTCFKVLLKKDQTRSWRCEWPVHNVQTMRPKGVMWRWMDKSWIHFGVWRKEILHRNVPPYECLTFFFFDVLGNAKAFQASLICLYCGRKLWNLKAPAFAPVCLCKSCSSEVPHCSVLPHLSGRENKLCLPGLLCASYCLPSVSPANHASIRSQLATHVPVAMCLSLPLFYISWYDSCLINSFIIIVILDSQHLI